MATATVATVINADADASLIIVYSLANMVSA